MIDVHALKQSHPIADVIADAGVELRHAGRRLVGRCPLHADREPSLSVYPDTQSYFCFSCGVGGDVIDFVCRHRKLDFREAARQLGETTLASPGPVTRLTSPSRYVEMTPELRSLLDAAVCLFQRALWSSEYAQRALQRRGIDEATALRCRLGFGHTSLAADLQRQGFDLAIARSVGLLSKLDRNVVGGRLIIPDLTAGSATWFTARSINGELPRYLNLNLSQASDRRTARRVAGEGSSSSAP